MEEARYWIDRLHLEPHPEGGHYRQTYRSPFTLPRSSLPGYAGDRAASTAIYFLLAGNQFSAFHRLRSDEVWHFYAGSALIVHVIEPDGNYRQLFVGNNPEQDEVFQAVVPAGCWFGSSLRQPNTYALVGCTVAPGFDFADFEMARREKLAAQFPQYHRAPHARQKDRVILSEAKDLQFSFFTNKPHRERPKGASAAKRAEGAPARAASTHSARSASTGFTEAARWAGR
jgi:predicted cupin superfamily sugar epimerase